MTNNIYKKIWIFSGVMFIDSVFSLDRFEDVLSCSHVFIVFPKQNIRQMRGVCVELNGL